MKWFYLNLGSGCAQIVLCLINPNPINALIGILNFGVCALMLCTGRYV